MKYVASLGEFKLPDMHAIVHVSVGHLARGDAMPLPDRVEIAPDPESGHYFMTRYTNAGEFCGDTWHEDLEAAFDQANVEFGLNAADFLLVHDKPHGNAA